MAWSKTVTTGRAPSARAGHTSTALALALSQGHVQGPDHGADQGPDQGQGGHGHGPRIIFFAGGDGARYLNDVVALDTGQHPSLASLSSFSSFFSPNCGIQKKWNGRPS